jgi:ABC-2 type transport system permease protein
MKTTLLLAQRELGAYLSTTWGYIILFAVLLIDGLLFNAYAMGDTPRYSAEVLEEFFELCSGTTMIAGILMTMRLIAEERQNSTMTLLDTAPISEAQIVIGKYLGAFAFLTIITLLTVYMPVLIQINGKISFGEIAAGYVGLLALGSASIAIGTLGSALARNQLLAAVLGGSMLGLMVIGWLTATLTEPPLSDLLAYVAIFDRHFQPFMRGRINTESLIYFASVTFIFLLLATRVLQFWRQA